MTELFFIMLIIAWILDGILRKGAYIHDFEELFKEMETNKTNSISTVINKIDNKWLKVLDNAYKSHGLEGKFDLLNICEDAEYAISGIPIIIGSGVVFDKRYVSTEEIVSGMAKYKQDTGQQIQAISDAIEDKYFVKVFSQDTMDQFVVSDKGLFDNCEKGDRVAVTFNEEGLFSIGYRIKGRSNGKI